MRPGPSRARRPRRRWRASGLKCSASNAWAIHDNFYELGGDSIINIQVIARAKREGLHFTPRQLLQNQTVAELAAVLSERRTDVPPPAPVAVAAPPSDASRRTPSDFPLAALDEASLERLNGGDPNVEDIYRLTPTQTGMLYHTLSEPGAYVEQLSWELHGPLDRDALAGAWLMVVDRHAALRTSFHWESAAEPVQIVRRQIPVRLDALDWGDASEEEVERRLRQFLASDRERGFELSTAPLMRLTLIGLGEGKHRFVWTHHHLLLDGWSMPIILKEVFAFYDTLSTGREPQLESPRPYRDYVAWTAAQDLAEAERFWRARVGDFDSPTPLPGAQPAPDEAAHTPADVSRRVPDEVADALGELARRTHVTLGTLLHGAWALLLSRYAGSEEVLFGSTVAGRPSDLPGVDSMVGLFINTLPVRVRVEPAEALLPWLVRLHEAQSEARQYEHAPLRLIQSWSGVGGGAPLFESVLVIENYPVGNALRERAAGAGAGIERERPRRARADQLPLDDDRRGGQGADAQSPLRLFARGGLGRRARARTLRAATRSDGSRPFAEAVGTGRARRRSAAATARRVERHPPRIFVGGLPPPTLRGAGRAHARRRRRSSSKTERLTYRELNERANRLAHHLRALGVGPDALVGVLHGALARDGRRAARRAQGGRRLRAARPGLPGRAPRASCSTTRACAVLLTQQRLPRPARRHGRGPRRRP